MPKRLTHGGWLAGRLFGGLAAYSIVCLAGSSLAETKHVVCSFVRLGSDVSRVQFFSGSTEEPIQSGYCHLAHEVTS